MSKKHPEKPEWTPPGAGPEFASSVLPGTDGTAQRATRFIQREPRDLAYYSEGILEGNRTVLARAITLVESNHPGHHQMARELVAEMLPRSGNSLRVGVTGVPGAGKSTFIDALGSVLCSRGRRVAVLAVDPSSTVSGGSVLGDKTRMERLVRHENSFIRPSPTGGTLGGVTRKSRETIVLCEAFGFDTILVETVGVGQSEISVRSMVDFFLLLMIAGAGDELQGIKKGVIEIADALAVNKADGPNALAAKAAKQQYAQALRYLSPATPGWTTRVSTCSALTGEGVVDVWTLAEQFEAATKESGFFIERRKQQRVDWTMAMAEQYLLEEFYQHPKVQSSIGTIRADVASGRLTTSRGASQLLEMFRGQSIHH